MNEQLNLEQLNLLFHAFGIGMLSLLKFIMLDVASRMVSGNSAIQQTLCITGQIWCVGWSMIGYCFSLYAISKIFCCISIPGCPCVLVNGLLLLALCGNVPSLVLLSIKAHAAYKEQASTHHAVKAKKKKVRKEWSRLTHHQPQPA